MRRRKKYILIIVSILIMLLTPGCDTSKDEDTIEFSTTQYLASNETELSSTTEETEITGSPEAVSFEIKQEYLDFQWYNSLKPEGKAGPVLTITEDGESKYSIVIPDNALDTEKTAAKELQNWIFKITKAQLPIYVESSLPDDDSGIISIGKTTLLSDTFPEMASVELENGGWGIAGNEEDLFLWGAEGRGNVNAVYAFLEEDIGCRWYTKDYTVLPETDNLKVSPVSRTYSPVFLLRDPFYTTAFKWEWSLHNRTNAPFASVPEEYGGHVDYANGHMFVHTFEDLIPAAEYFDEHPEYFMLDRKNKRQPYQLCTTNPDVVEIIIQKVHALLEEYPDTEIISVSKNDLVQFCEDPGCKKLDDAEGTHMASLLYLVNKVAESIKDKYPDVYISTLAYLETSDPPVNMRPDDNVIIRLCNDSTGSWIYPFKPASIMKIGDLVMQWSSIHENLYIWDYVMNFEHFMAPMPNLDVIADNIRFYAENNVQGVMMQGNMQGKGAEREAMRVWVMSKLMLYPYMDIDELIMDFVYGYFGEAAPPIMQYYNNLESRGKQLRGFLTGGIRYSVDNVFFGKKFLDESDILFDEAERLSAEDNELILRIKRERLPIMYVKLVRGPEFTGEEYEYILKEFFQIAVLNMGVTNLAEGSSDIKEKWNQWSDSWKKYSGSD